MPDDSMRTRTATASGDTTDDVELDIDTKVNERWCETTAVNVKTQRTLFKERTRNTRFRCRKEGVGRRGKSRRLYAIIDAL